MRCVILKYGTKYPELATSIKRDVLQPKEKAHIIFKFDFLPTEEGKFDIAIVSSWFNVFGKRNVSLTCPENTAGAVPLFPGLQPIKCNLDYFEQYVSDLMNSETPENLERFESPTR